MHSMKNQLVNKQAKIRSEKDDFYRKMEALLDIDELDPQFDERVV